MRGCDAFVLQSHSAPINDQIMEHLIMVDALKRASAKRITVVMPFWGYSRQDKKHRGREPISARLVADLFKVAGADRIMTVDLHTSQIQGFFDGPVDHLFALPVLAQHVRRSYADHDARRGLPRLRPRPARRALGPTTLGGTPLAFIHKTRDPRKPQRGRGEPRGRRHPRPALRRDRRYDRHGRDGVQGRGGAAERRGPSDVVVAATHGVLSGPATERLVLLRRPRGGVHRHAARSRRRSGSRR